MFVKELMRTPRCLVRKPPQKGATHKVISQLQRGDDEKEAGMTKERVILSGVSSCPSRGP
jgi:hypothetical protein